MPALLRWLLRLGPTNPICVRLVQGGSRRTRHLYLRTAYLAVLIVGLLWSLLFFAGGGQLSYARLAAAGAASFQYVAYLQIGLICVLSPVFMSGAIAQEANPRTWDILLTTPMPAGHIVLGNLLGRLFFVLALLFASLPLFAITQYFGGAPGRSIFLSYVIAAGAALLVGAIAVTLSVSRVAGRRAVFAFYVSVVSYLALTWTIDLWLRGGWGGVTPLTALNPFLALESLLDPAGYPTPDPIDLAAMPALQRLWLGSPVLTWFILSLGLSVVLIVASTVMVRHVPGTADRTRRARFPFFGRGGQERAPRYVWHNPVAWREAAARASTLPKIVARWSFIAAGALWGIGVVAYFHSGGITIETFRFALLATVWTELIVIALVAINMAATAVSREREDGTLDLLLITPITPGQYLGGKLRGLVSFLSPMLAVPVGTVALASLYVLLGGLGRSGGVIMTELVGTERMDLPAVLPEGAIVAPLTVVPFIAFVVMVGLQWSVKSKGALASVVGTVAVVGVLAGIIGVCGWRAGLDVAYLGPILGALNPVTAMLVIIEPGAAEQTLLSTADRSGLRVSLIAGAAIAAVIYTVVIYTMRASMVRTFDMTVRRLSGMR